MSDNVTRFPTAFDRAIAKTGFTVEQINEGVSEFIKGYDGRMNVLRKFEVHTLRYMWDNVGDNSFYEGREGQFDCAEIHAVLNEKGDGYYCSV